MLVVEDAAARRPLAQWLRDHGLQVVEAGSTAEAVGLALFGRLDCVIAQLGNGDGLRLSSRLRNTPATVALPVVLVDDGTAVTGDDLRAAGVTVTLAQDRAREALLAGVHDAIASVQGRETPERARPA
jgi:CheY-like chemotaxis protein